MKSYFVFMTVVFSVVAQTPPSSTMHQDFRGGKFNNSIFQLAPGPQAADLAKAEPDGLHITIAKRKEKNYPVGIKFTRSVKGDFVATFTYSLLGARRPAKDVVLAPLFS